MGRDLEHPDQDAVLRKKMIGFNLVLLPQRNNSGAADRTYFVVVGAVGGLLDAGVLLLLADLHTHDGVHVEPGQLPRFDDGETHLQDQRHGCSTSHRTEPQGTPHCPRSKKTMCNPTSTKPVVCACVVGIGSHPTKTWLLSLAQLLSRPKVSKCGCVFL